MTGPTDVSPANQSLDERRSLETVALLFLKLGTIAFGGPAAHIAMMNGEVVERRRWMTREKFLDLLGAASLIPGPSSTELAIYIGYIKAGWPGLLLGGICFILPATLIVSAFAWAYVRFGSLPEITGILYGVKPVVIVIVVQAISQLGRTALKTRFLSAIGVCALVASLLGANQLVVLLSAGLLALTANQARNRLQRISAESQAGWLATPFAIGLQSGATALSSVGLWPLFLFFLKIGSIVFGSGYVLLAFLRSDLVEHLHWLTNSQLLDAVAIGQVTPGPVFTTATFIGYILAGSRGAFVATLGMFLPSFILVAVSGPLLPRIKRSTITGPFLDGVSVAAVALMAAVTLQLGRVALIDFPTVLIAIFGAIAAFRFRLNSTWLVLGGAAIGAAAHVLIK